MRVKTRQDAFECVAAARNGCLSGVLTEAYVRGLREMLLAWVDALDGIIESTRWCNDCGKRCSGRLESFDGIVCSKCSALSEKRDKLSAEAEKDATAQDETQV